MSEADSPNNESGLPTSESIDATAFTTDSTAADASSSAQDYDDGWQTIAFPGAISIDAIPHMQVESAPTGELSQPMLSGIIHYSDASISPAAANFAANPTEATAIQAVPSMSSGESVAEIDAVDASDRAHGAETAPARVNQLFQELERSHQATQRQQILVETLTEQLASCQERIAHLERDCALTQQRYNEQVQQVLQVETTCRDLRMRLHRQQQQTLQFKAALEKCLEMPSPYSYGQVLLDFSQDGGATDGLPASSDLLKPKHQPVKPWSAGTSHDAAVRSFGSQSELFQASYRDASQPQTGGMNEAGIAAWELLDALAVPPSDTAFSEGASPDLRNNEPSLLHPDDPAFVTHLVQLIFPDVAQPAASVSDMLSEGSFDPSPFLNVEKAPSASAWSTDDATAAATPDLNTRASDDPLWEDLATLIEPVQSLAPASPAAAASADCDRNVTDLTAPANVVKATVALSAANPPAENELPMVRSGQPSAILPLFATMEEVEDGTEAPATKPPTAGIGPQLDQWTWRDRLVNRKKNGRSTDSDSVDPSAKSPEARESPELSAVRSQLVRSRSTTAPGTPFATNAPSPIVYPLRPTRKLASLAAVDLPSFPKR